MNQEYLEQGFMKWDLERARIRTENPVECVIYLRPVLKNLIALAIPYFRGRGKSIVTMNEPDLVPLTGHPRDFVKYWSWMQQAVDELRQLVYESGISRLSPFLPVSEIKLDNQAIGVKVITQ